MGMTPIQAKQLGELIARARARRGLSVRGLADSLGISFSWLAKLETGTYADPSPALLTKVADALEMDPARLDRMSKGAVTDGLPEPRVYFRTKLEMSPEESEQVMRYIKRMRGKQ